MNQGCTCIIPFYNEQEKIVTVLQALSSLPDLDKIIVVDDGSTDHSKALVQKYSSHHSHIQLLSYPDNKGKSHAVYWGLQQVETPYILLFDADLSHIRPDEIAHMIRSLYDNSHIDMGILRRTSSNRYIKLFYRELILSGQRMLRTADLQQVFNNNVDRYQLEVAINSYMEDHGKLTLWYAFSAQNAFKPQKRGFWYGRKRDLLMYKDIFSYLGFIPFCRHIFSFKPQHVLQYLKNNAQLNKSQS